MLNKKGRAGSKIFLGVFVFMIVIILGGLATGIFIFFGSGYDFRTTDANVLNSEIRDCLISKDVDWNVDGDFYEKCGFNREVMEENYVYGIVQNNNVLLKFGDYIPCEFEGEKSNEFTKCFVRSIGDVKVIIGSNQRARVAAG